MFEPVIGSRRARARSMLSTILPGLLLAIGFASHGAHASSNPMSALPGSSQSRTDTDAGEYASASMTVELVLAPSNAGELSSLLSNLYDAQSPSYHQWLAPGEFTARFAPDSGKVAALTEYLQSNGLTVLAAASPFFLRVTGPSSVVSSALKTSIHNYVNKQGVTYFANASPIQLPSDLAPAVLGVVGATNTVRLRSRVAYHKHRHPNPACEAPYVTAEQLFDFYNNNVNFPSGYGGGPGCNGLTPSQTNSIYSAPDLGPEGQGLGVKLAVFELSAYQHSDIETWAHTFYGSKFTPPLVDITVDGGPLTPACPGGDTCPASLNGYSGDIEVDADIEMQLTIAPAAKHILVYNAPNDFSGQTSLDEYYQIAQDDRADVISSSWGVCENDLSAGYVEAENLIFEQMALQGQSMFAAGGDNGAFGCLDTDGTSIVDLGDPAEPWVTVVGGTSFTSFNPGGQLYPQYPRGTETVWNDDNLCNQSADEGGFPGLFWCGTATGAGAGGSSQWWGRPFYQFGPGINNPYTLYGNGGMNCALAKKGTPCREAPDISANADEYTPYAEYCTGSAATAYSTCGSFSGGQTPPGWFGIGGTSLSSPLWSAIIADRVSFQHGRVGNVNPLLYWLYRTNPRGYFHDITGVHQSETNNGLYPTTPGYDLATGIGTPKMEALITGLPQYD
jgi:subtilase family serine protease